MWKLYQYIVKYKFAYLGLSIQILFYVSTTRTGWFDIFFSGNAIQHCCHGLDFYQVPNGAYAYWHYGSLTGTPLPNHSFYAQGYFVNDNVYHPLFTLALGSLLIQFSPEQTFYVWMFFKLAITLASTAYFFWSFRECKYIGFAVFVLLANFTQYLEISIGQYHALLNDFLLLLLVNVARQKSPLWGGLLYCLSLFVKPIGILWAWVFLCKGRFRIALVGGILFTLCTGAFLLNGVGSYYTNNLVRHFLYPIAGGPNQLITLAGLLHYSFSSWPDIVFKLINYLALGIVLFWSSLKRTHISKSIFLAVVYYLFFYDYVFEYHYTSVAPVVAVCIVCCPEFQTLWARIFAFLTCLPSVFVLLNYWHIDVKPDNFYGPNTGALGWQLITLSKIVPIILLCISVMAPDVKPAYREVKAFWLAIRKLNKKMDVFG